MPCSLFQLSLRLFLSRAAPAEPAVGSIELQLRDQLLLPVVNKYQYISYAPTPRLSPLSFFRSRALKILSRWSRLRSLCDARRGRRPSLSGYKMLVRERKFLFALSSSPRSVPSPPWPFYPRGWKRNGRLVSALLPLGGITAGGFFRRRRPTHQDPPGTTRRVQLIPIGGMS